MLDLFYRMPKKLPNKVEGKVIAVIAGNYRQFEDYCTRLLIDFERGNEHYSGWKFIYCNSPENILGYRFDDMTIVGTLSDDFEQIYDLVISRIRI